RRLPRAGDPDPPDLSRGPGGGSRCRGPELSDAVPFAGRFRGGRARARRPPGRGQPRDAGGPRAGRTNRRPRVRRHRSGQTDPPGCGLGGTERVAGSLFNDLEAPVVRRHPEIAEAKRSLLHGGALGAVMSGSGPTVFGVLAGPDARVDRRIEEEIVGLTGRPPAYVTAKGSRAR